MQSFIQKTENQMSKLAVLYLLTISAKWKYFAVLYLLTMAAIKWKYFDCSPVCTQKKLYNIFFVELILLWLFLLAVEALVRVDDALSRKDKDLLLQLLKSHDLGIRNVKDENIDFYIIHLDEARDNKMVNNF